MEFPRQPTAVVITITSGHPEDTYKAKLLIDKALRNHYADVSGYSNNDTCYVIQCYPFAVND